jgi:hypothetical protein
VTRLPSGTPPSPPDPVLGGSFFLTCCPRFIDNATVVFQTYVDPDGSNPEHTFAGFTVRIDGSRLEPVPIPVSVPGGKVIPSFAVGGGRGTSLIRLSLSGTPVKHRPAGDGPITEVFVRDGENLRQLTNFRCQDGRVPQHRPDARVLPGLGRPARYQPQRKLPAVLHWHSRWRQIAAPGDPLHLAGPYHRAGMRRCRLGVSGLPDRKRVLPCGPSISVTKAIVFESTCDRFHVNPFGDQLFAMRPDGGGLRQLTDASGMTTNPDGSFRVELPGPYAYSAELR